MQLSLLLRGIDPLGITGRTDGEVASVCYDSRQCRKGSLFVAIPGLKADGHAIHRRRPHPRRRLHHP